MQPTGLDPAPPPLSRATRRAGDPSLRLPAVFRRDAVSKAAGLLVYVLATPFVALFLALFLSLPAIYLLGLIGVDEVRARYAFPVLLCPSVVLVIAWAVREYRQRAAVEVVVDRD